ncbi:MAG TPA: hypothetical protein VK196_20165 [Magnetospirillum sp.]|nr:hypothetical protein [Magnetospirillum sp.]
MTTAIRVPFSAGSRWAELGWALWRRRPMLFILTALMVLGLRWLLDLLTFDDTSAVLIVLSYLTDALLVGTLWMALTGSQGETGLRDGWRRLKGRRWRVARAGLWGLPSAAIGFVLLSLASTLLQPVGMLVGARAAGWLMLAWIFLCGWLCCLLLFGALFAAIEAARGDDTLWAAGMKGMRAAALGWRPLLAVWTAFACGATLFAAAAANVLGHVSFDLLDGPARDWLEHWINWPALFVAVMVLLAILTPAARQLFAAAEHHAEVEGLTVAAFGELAARRIGLALRALAAAFALAGLFAIDIDLGTCLLGGAGLWLTGRSLGKCAPAWSSVESSFWARWKWVVTTALPWLLVWSVWALG